MPQSCRFKDQNCRSCKKQGHIEKKCTKKKASGTSGRVRNNDRDPMHYADDADDTTDFGGPFHVRESNLESSIMIPVQLNGTKVSMEPHTGASVSVMSESTWKEKFSQNRIQLSSVQLKTYRGENPKVLGQLQVNVDYNAQGSKLPIHIVKGSRPMLLGRNWLKAIRLNWGTIKKATNDLDQVLHKHNEVFKDELGTMKDTHAKLYVKLNCNPKFCKPRSAPHALKGDIEEEYLDPTREPGRRYSWCATIPKALKEQRDFRHVG